MKNILLLSIAVFTLFSCKKESSNNVVPLKTSTTYDIYFLKSDSLFYSNSPVGDTLFLNLSAKNIAFGSTVVLTTKINSGQIIQFIGNDFVIQNLQSLPLTARHNTTLSISIYPLSISNTSPYFYSTFVSISDIGN